MKASQLKFLGIGGVIWFSVIIALAGIVTPNYSHVSQAISELGEPGAPYQWIVNFGGFVPLGVAIMISAIASYKFSESETRSKTIPALFGLTSLAVIIAGLFPTDPGGRRDTTIGIIHAFAGVSILSLAAVTPLATIFFDTLKSAGIGFKIYSIATALALVGLFLMTPNAVFSELVTLQRAVLGDWFSVWYGMLGIHQRGFLLIYCAWLVSFLAR